jgi:heme A synthase
MFGTGSRFYYALGVLGLLGAVAYGLATDGSFIGVVSAGYKGGVGEHFGYAVLLGFGVVSLALGVTMTLVRDADPVPVVVGAADVLPEVEVPDTSSPWPLVGAVGAVITVLGLVTGWGLFVLGLVVVAIAIVEWAVKVWADRATGDPEVNRRIRNRFMAPIEIPIGAFLVIGFMVLGVSRVLLAVSAHAAVGIAVAVLVVIVIGALIVASRPNEASRVATVLLVLLALLVIAGGIAGVAAGEREFEEHEPAHEAAD